MVSQHSIYFSSVCTVHKCESTLANFKLQEQNSMNFTWRNENTTKIFFEADLELLIQRDI